MPTAQAVSWEIKVSKDTDESLQSFLRSQGLSLSDLSPIVEEAVRDYVFFKVVDEVHQQNRGLDPDVVQSAVDTALEDVRAERRAQLQQSH